MASSINEKNSATNKRRLDGSEPEDGQKGKKVKTSKKDDYGYPQASSNGDQSSAEIISTRTITKRELRDPKSARKQDVKSPHKQKPAEVSRVRLASVNRPNKLESKIIPPTIELTNAKNEEGRLLREQGAGTLMARNKALENAGGQTRRRKVRPSAKNDQGLSAKYSWTLSDAVGGQMLGLDPIFSFNEE